MTARLMDLMQENSSDSGEALLGKVAEEIRHPQPETVVRGGAEIMENLRRHDIILGTIRS